MNTRRIQGDRLPTGRDLRGMFGAGRDVSAEAIIALIGASPHEIRIERVQADTWESSPITVSSS